MKIWLKILGGILLVVFGALVLRQDKDLQQIVQTPSSTPEIQEIIRVIQSPLRVAENITTGEVAGTQDEDDVANFEVATVKRVVDGDTIELSDGRRVRYIGMDTPETVHPSRPVECLGPEAAQKNIELVEGKEVRLEKDISETDRLDRLLRYVYVGDVMVNEVLVREGFAQSSKYPPDTKHQELLDEAELFARQQKWGIWSHVCASVAPTPTVTPKVPTPSPTVLSGQSYASGNCLIKGNINRDDEKIYHVLGCSSYDVTKIDPERGERFFCSEAEAQTAGWRKAGNC